MDASTNQFLEYDVYGKVTAVYEVAGNQNIVRVRYYYDGQVFESRKIPIMNWGI